MFSISFLYFQKVWFVSIVCFTSQICLCDRGAGERGGYLLILEAGRS